MRGNYVGEEAVGDACLLYNYMVMLPPPPHASCVLLAWHCGLQGAGGAEGDEPTNEGIGEATINALKARTPGSDDEVNQQLPLLPPLTTPYHTYL